MSSSNAVSRDSSSDTTTDRTLDTAQQSPTKQEQQQQQQQQSQQSQLPLPEQHHPHDAHSHPPLVLNPALFPPPSKQAPNTFPLDPAVPEEEEEEEQQQAHAPSLSPDHSTTHIPVDDLSKNAEVEVDTDLDADDTSISPPELTLLYRTRNRAPPPGAVRVLKTVRLRKKHSSSKRRNKKQNLRVMLKDKDRIEEEMAQYRGSRGLDSGKGKKKAPAARYVPESVGLGSGPRGPSSLRYSETCDYDDDEGEGEGEGGENDEDEEEEEEDIAEDKQESRRSLKRPRPMEWQQQTTAESAAC